MFLNELSAPGIGRGAIPHGHVLLLDQPSGKVLGPKILVHCVVKLAKTLRGAIDATNSAK